MITKERAVELVGALLERERPNWAWARLIPALVVTDARECPVGWLVHWTSDWAARNPDKPTNLDGGPFLVDRHDGSIHFVPESRWSDDWEERYLREVKGAVVPDPLAAAVRRLAASAGTAAAMRHLRREAPRIGLPQAKAYVAAVRDGSEPPEELAALTREPEPFGPPHPIETLAGPVV